MPIRRPAAAIDPVSLIASRSTAFPGPIAIDDPSVEGFTKRLCRVAALGKKQIGPRIDEERHSLLLGRLANDGDAAFLPLEVVESRTFNDPIFKVDADYAQVEKTRDVVGQFALVFAIPAFEVHGHRDVDGRDNPPDDLLGQPDRDGLAICSLAPRRQTNCSSRSPFRLL